MLVSRQYRPGGSRHQQNPYFPLFVFTEVGCVYRPAVLSLLRHVIRIFESFLWSYGSGLGNRSLRLWALVSCVRFSQQSTASDGIDEGIWEHWLYGHRVAHHHVGKKATQTQRGVRLRGVGCWYFLTVWRIFSPSFFCFESAFGCEAFLREFLTALWHTHITALVMRTAWLSFVDWNFEMHQFAL